MPAKKSRGSRSLPRERISIDFLIIADAAQEVGGKLYLLGGGWTLHHARGYPSALGFGLAIGILVPWAETNRKHKFTFAIRESEGAEVARGEGSFEAGREVGITVGMVQRVIAALSGQLLLPSAGTYEVVATVSGEERRITFEALAPKAGS